MGTYGSPFDWAYDNEIADRDLWAGEGIPLKTLQALTRARAIAATYGSRGGYQLSGEARDNSVQEIVEPIEGLTGSLSGDIQTRNTFLLVGRIVEEADAE